MALDILSALQVTIETVKKYVDNLVVKKADVAQDTSNAGKVWTVADDGGLTFSDGSVNGVQYVPQTLNEEQKLQARNNIGVGETIADTLISLELAKPLAEDDDDVLATVDGVILAYDKDEDKFVKTVNGIEPDENGNVEVGTGSGSGGGVSSWNDLTDKPFYELNETVMVQWDYSAEGRETTTPEGVDITIAKISNDIVDYSTVTSAYMEISYVDGSTVKKDISRAYVVHDGGLTAISYGFDALYLVPDGGVESQGMALTGGIWAIVNKEDNAVSVTHVFNCSSMKPLDEKFIPDTIARKTDLNWENLTDKPFYEAASVVLYKNENLAFVEDDGHYESGVVSEIALESEKEYLINWDGTNYMCVCVKVQSNDQYNGMLLGNLSLFDSSYENTGEPFLIECIHAIDADMYMSAFITTSTIDMHAVVISGGGITIKTLDEKYIPDTIVRVSDISGLTNLSSTAQVGQTLIVKAIDENGKPTEWECVDMPSWIPEITESDEGAVLRVVNGVPTWVQATDAQDATF